MDESKSLAVEAAEKVKRDVLKDVELYLDNFIGWVSPDKPSFEMTIEIKYGGGMNKCTYSWHNLNVTSP